MHTVLLAEYLHFSNTDYINPYLKSGHHSFSTRTFKIPCSRMIKAKEKHWLACGICGYCTVFAENWSLVRCDTVFLGEKFPTFWRMAGHSSTRSGNQRRMFCLGLLDPDNEGPMILCNFRVCSPCDNVSSQAAWIITYSCVW